MSDPARGIGRLTVGNLAFDPESGDLAGPTGSARIAPQPASLLALLASRPGALVSRDEVREHLWPGGKVEFEQGIAFAVREIRRAIEAVGGDPALLETIPKRGFRVGANEASPPTLAKVETASPAAATSSSAPPRRVDSPRLLLLPVAVVLIVAAIGLRFALSPSTTFAIPSVVVFPHDVEDDTHEEMARALGFELTTALTRSVAGRMGVVGPTGSARLAGPDDTEGARATLGACLVVSGGMRAHTTDSVIVFTQIVRASDRVHVWARVDTVRLATPGVVVPGIVDGVEGAAGRC